MKGKDRQEREEMRGRVTEVRKKKNEGIKVFRKRGRNRSTNK